jgi:DNA repair exonuclease SbcCD ATPase subunit
MRVGNWGNMWERFEGLSPDAKSLVIAVLGAVAGAVAGAIVKWLLDRSKIRELKQLVEDARQEREDAKRERQAAIEGRESALREREQALRDLARREAESQERQRKLDELQRTVDGRAVDVGAQKTKLGKLLETLRGSEAGLWTTFPKQPPFDDFDRRCGLTLVTSRSELLTRILMALSTWIRRLKATRSPPRNLVACGSAKWPATS